MLITSENIPLPLLISKLARTSLHLIFIFYKLVTNFFVSLTKRKVIKPVVSDKFKLDQATEALSKLKDGKIMGRGVINP